MTHFALPEPIASDGFMPHGMCYLWQPGILRLHVFSDGLIAAAYFSIPFTLLYFVRRRADLQFNWIFKCFAVFIVACGMTHVMDIWTIWQPMYWLAGGIKAGTAVVSAATSLLLIQLVPQALELPSPAVLRRLNRTLEARVTERTIQLETLNRTLQRENARFALAADAAGLGFWSLDGDPLKLQWDDRMFRLYGRPPADEPPSFAEWAECLHPDDRERCTREVADAFARGGGFETEFRIIRPDGAVRHLRAAARIARNSVDGIEHMYGVDFDVTERKQAEAVQQQMAALVESADDAIMTKDLDGIIGSWNRAAERLLGYGAAEIIGQPMARLLPEDRQDEESMILHSIRTGTRVASFETVRRRKDGSLVDVSLTISPVRDRSGSVIGASKIMRDITERRRATEHFRLALEASSTGMLMADPTGKIVLVNGQVETLFGYSRAELLGREVEMLLPERFRDRHPGDRRGFFAAPEVRAMAPSREIVGRRKDGSEVPVGIELHPLRTAEGSLVLASIVDQSKAREMDRMRSDFISTVSHELRTPLTSITGALGLLQSGAVGTLSEKGAAMVRIARQNSERLVRIINDILDIGKLEAGKMTFHPVAVPLSGLLRQSIEANAGYADKYGVTFRLDDESSGALAWVDPDRCMQALTNLLSNAAKFSPAGAEVLIRARCAAGMLRVEVEDSGPGIPAEFQGRIFDKFSQADASTARPVDGTGLGLSIARQLAEGMGGRIGFSSRTGRGSIFHLDLPRLTSDAPDAGSPDAGTPPSGTPQSAAPPTAPAHSDAHVNVPKVLYVEDDGDLVSVIGATLAERAVVVAARGLEEAERLLREDRFQLVILDQALPDGNGAVLIDRISQLAGKALPVVIFSAWSVAADVHAKVTQVFLKSETSPKAVVDKLLSYLDPPPP